MVGPLQRMGHDDQRALAMQAAGEDFSAFIWGMAGENYIYTDMDAVAIKDLR
jgi:5-keto 4-deoxyuronate isomerase